MRKNVGKAVRDWEGVGQGRQYKEIELDRKSVEEKRRGKEGASIECRKGCLGERTCYPKENCTQDRDVGHCEERCGQMAPNGGGQKGYNLTRFSVHICWALRHSSTILT